MAYERCRSYIQNEYCKRIERRGNLGNSDIAATAQLCENAQ